MHDGQSENSDIKKAQKKHKKSLGDPIKKESARISHISPGFPPSSPGGVPCKSSRKEEASRVEKKKLGLSQSSLVPTQGGLVLVETPNDTAASMFPNRTEKILLDDTVQLVTPSPVPSQIPNDHISGHNLQRQSQHRDHSDATLVVAEPVQALEEQRNEEYVAAKAARQLEERMACEWQRRLELDVEAQLHTKKQVVSTKADKKAIVDEDDSLLLCDFKSRTCVVAFLVLVVAGGLIGVMLAVLSKDSKNPSLTTTPTEAPTVSMSSTLSRRDYILETIGDRIAPNNSTEEWALLNDPSTPQGKALLWLSEKDDFSSQPTKLDTQVLLDRYALAVFYFSIAIREALSESHFLDGSLAACQWNNGGTAGHDGTQGVHCTDMSHEWSVSYMQLPNLDLQGTLPWELSLLQNVIALYLDFNEFEGSIPTQVAKLSKLQAMFLHYNSLSGPIPANMPPSLQGLSLAENQLSGSLSSEWASSMASLNTCLLGNNRLEGSIPSELGTWNKLLWFDLGDNTITGSIPTELGSLGNIQHLYLDRNLLTGTLPTELGYLSKLQRIYVHHNGALTGTVPTEYTRLTALDMFLFSNTSLIGSVESTFCDSTIEPLTLWGDCAGVAPEIECSCCTKCCSFDGGNC